MKKFLAALVSPFVLALAANAQPRPMVTNISVKAGRGGEALLSWTPPDGASGAEELLVFRSARPITSASQIQNVSPRARLSPDATGWIDAPPAGGECFYAVVAVARGERFDVIIPSANATTKGAQAAAPSAPTAVPDAGEDEKLYPGGVSRETPLPSLSSGRGESSVSGGAVQSPKTEGLAARASGRKMLARHIFKEDLVSPENGDDIFLFDSLKTYFIRKKYSESVESLSKLLATNLSESVARRATFYLGESYYFLGRYESAFKAFVSLMDFYPELSKKWIDSSLDMMDPPASSRD